MKKYVARAVLLAITLLLFNAHRLPAPIVEEEKPTPAAEQSEAPKRKHSARAKTSDTSQTAQPRRAATPQPTPANRFAGTWTGTMPEVPWGNVTVELRVDATEKTMEWIGAGNSHGTAKATLTGNTLSALFPGWPRPVWSITPDPGGNSAQVRLRAFMNDQTATFHRTDAAPAASKLAR